MSISDALRLGRAAAVTLSRTHAKGLVHGALSPQSLWVDAELGEARLAALDLCFTDAGSLERPPQPERRHDLRYLAPELSTPGMRGDRRADLYALGVILYEALTGRLPFEISGSVAIHHAHSAVEAEPAERLRSDVPPALSELIAALLAKDLDERYQSAIGVRSDIDRILAAQADEVSPQPSLTSKGLRDAPRRPASVFGRESAIREALQLFSPSEHGAFGLIHGASGTGKSTLVDCILGQVPRDWIVGRAGSEPVPREPFAAIRAPIETVLAGIEAAGEASRLAFETAAADTLSGSAVALRAILPAIERYVDSSVPGPRLPAQAGETRVHVAFHGLLVALAAAGRPVAIVLDDVQWADAATVALLRSVASSPNAPPVTIVLVFRSEEVEGETELSDIIAAVRAHPALGLDLQVEPLAPADLRALVAECLDSDEEEVAPLATTIHAHSCGNALFAVEELQELWSGGVLRRDALTGAWEWETTSDAAVPYSQKLSELIALRLHRLPLETRKLVAAASCFGRGCNRAQLGAVTGVELEELQRRLVPAFREGVLVADDSSGSPGSMRFGHDQIRTAAWSTLDEETRSKCELQIGTLLLGAKNNADDGLLEAIAHLNSAARMLARQGRGRWLARRNLEASRVASARGAFADAYGYLQRALDMLEEADWRDQDELMREVHLEAARAACLSSAAASALPLVDTLRRFARHATDEVAAMEVAIEALKVLDRFSDALDVGIEALGKLGIDLPQASSRLRSISRLLATHWRISRRGYDRLSRLPAMDDPRGCAAMRILSELTTPCFLLAPALFPAIVDAQLRLSLQLGNAPQSANAYALYAVILAGPLGRITQAHDVGVATLEVLERTDRSQIPRTTMALYVFVMPWSIPLRDCLHVYLEGSRAALEVGDPEFANYHASAWAAYAAHAGPPLDATCRELDRLRSLILPLGQRRQYAADIYHQFCLNLRDDDADPLRLTGPIYDEEVDGKAHADAIEMNGHLYLVRLMLAVAFDRYDDLAALRKGVRTSMPAFSGMYVRAAILFYDALALLRRGPAVAARLNAVSALARMRRWQRHAPDNFRHKTLILRAELARLGGRLRRSQSLFEEAAIAAERAGFHLEAGLALEGAQAVAAAREMDALAAHFVDEARRVYAEWGAAAKLRELGIRFGSARVGDRASSVGSWDLAPASLDLVGVLEASQALSAGMDLDTTIHKIMQTVVGLSGAQRGVLLRETDDGFSTLALAETDAGTLRVEVFAENDYERAAPQAGGYPASVVRDVIASGAPRIVSDPSQDSRYRDDPYFGGHASRALLCCPIMHGKRRTAVLYLEHSLRRDAFGERQLETVHLLSTQAAISLDNARLYARQLRLSRGAQRFVPHEFLLLLDKGDVDEVALSDFVRAEMTILVCDIRGFTTATEKMTPEANFSWINDFFAVVGPAVREHSGFVMKYMGDGLMALFPRSADDAAAAAVAINRSLRKLPIFRIGIGLHTGPVAIGAVGERTRLQADVMSDVVTVACRLETLTRQYGVPIVISVDTRDRLSPAHRERTQPLGRTAVKGRVGSIDIYSLE